MRERLHGIYVDEDRSSSSTTTACSYVEARRTSGSRRGTTSRRSTGELVYDPYLAELARAVTTVQRVDPDYTSGLEPAPPRRERLQLFLNHLYAWFLWKTPWLMRYRHRRWRHTGEPSAETA